MRLFMRNEMPLYREFAVDPEIFGIPGTMDKIFSIFGWEKGNILCALPDYETWQKNLGERQRNEFLARSKHCNFIIERNDISKNYNFQDWKDCATKHHQNYPFTNILTKNKFSSDCIFLNEMNNFDMFFGTHTCVKRDKYGISNVIELLLQSGPVVSFIDPYFTNPGYSEPFIEMIDKTLSHSIYRNRYKKSPITFEIHCQFYGNDSNGIKIDTLKDIERSKERIEEYQRDCKEQFNSKFKDILKGNILNIHFWLKCYDTIQMHNRYIFTRSGGVIIGWGLDSYEKRFGKNSYYPKDDIAILSLSGLQAYKDIYSISNNSKKRYLLFSITIE